jgi:transposase
MVGTMISAEQRARIRRLYYAEHWKVGTIASELGLHHETVRNAIKDDRVVNRNEPRVAPSILDPYKPFIGDMLAQHPRLRASRLFDMIRQRGYAGGEVVVRRYVRKVRPLPREAFFKLETMPGEQGQVDWASFGKIKIGSASRSLSCFVMVLSFSRAIFARFVLDQTTESFVHCHVLGFEAFGGVPRTLLYDNLKSVVLERVGEHVRFHPRILDLAGHYHFAPKPCAPYRGNEKGKVERAIQYLRHSFFAARRFASIADLNAQLAEWTARVAFARPRPQDPDRRSVRDAYEQEKQRLLSLPEHRFVAEHVKPIASGKTPYVHFDLNDYSIPAAFVRRPLTLAASETHVRLLDGTTEVARHLRSYDRGRKIEIRAHLEALATEKLRAAELRGRDRLTMACPRASSLLEQVALRGGHLGGTTSRLLRLLERYDPRSVDLAIGEALARGAASAEAVAHVLDQRRRAENAPPLVEVVLPDDPRIRDLHVTPHSLASYDDALRTSPNREPTDE